MKMFRWLMVLLASTTVATCGQKGPLELPDNEAAHGPSIVGFNIQVHTNVDSVRV